MVNQNLKASQMIINLNARCSNAHRKSRQKPNKDKIYGVLGATLTDQTYKENEYIDP